MQIVPLLFSNAHPPTIGVSLQDYVVHTEEKHSWPTGEEIRQLVTTSTDYPKNPEFDWRQR